MKGHNATRSRTATVHRRGRGLRAAGLLAFGTLVIASCSNADERAADAAPVETSATDPAPVETGVPAIDSAAITAVSEPATSTTSAERGGFAVPAARRTELEEAGFGWLLDIEYPAQMPDVPWPTDAWPTGPLPVGVDAAAVQAIVDEAFRPVTDDAGNEAGKVDALLAVSGGRLVLEAYNGWAPDAPHASWSMAKSVTQAMLGVLVSDGRLDPFAPAPVPEWSDVSDPRHDITVDALLHMRSGLSWEEDYAGENDVTTMLFGDGRTDRGGYAASKPLRDEPDTTFYYSTGSAMILSRIVSDLVGHGEAGTAWAQSALFDPLGITTVAHDLDGAGVISGGSNINMSARDFARFGLLYLRGGQWDGQQIVPQAWVDYARLPRPDAPEYGALWWVDDAADPQPAAFFADGFAGQLLVVVPSLDLVVVALANTQDGRSDDAAWALVDAFAADALARHVDSTDIE
jgi:CubicO group peptidase (beta-lactamase class C family)